MDVRTIKLEWEELDSLFENFFKEVLGKTIKCHVDFDDQTYWGVRFKNYEMPVRKSRQSATLLRRIKQNGRKHFLPMRAKPIAGILA